MKYRDLNNNDCIINFNNFTLIRDNVSSGHKTARKLIKELFPSDRAYEEVTLPITNRQNLFADFFIPTRRIIIEVNGQQHYTQNNFFHKSKKEFNRAKARDLSKQSWCDENQITLIVLNTKDSEDDWKSQISKRGAS